MSEACEARGGECPSCAADAPAYDLRRELLLFGLAAAAGALGLGLAPGGPLRLPSLPAATWIAALGLSYLLAGWNVLAGAARNIARGKVFDELFLMGIATLGAFAIGRYEEAVGVMAFYKIGEMLQESASERSRSSVRALLRLRPDVVRLRSGSGWEERDPESARIGDEFMVMPGERIPLDGIVLEGESFVDSSALTGESRPRRALPGSEAKAGCVALDGSLVLRASKTVGESAAARILQLVEDASRAKARTERLVSRFAAVYTPIVIGLAAATAFLPPLLFPGQSLSAWIYRALVMLVISCPCALVVSVPLGYFCGLGGAARRGILVKGSEVMDALARAKSAVFDKTGTLTEGGFSLLSIECAEGTEAGELLALAAAAESRSRHPIAAAIRRAALERGLSSGVEDEASEIREAAGYGVTAVVGERRVSVGSGRLMERAGAEPGRPYSGPATAVEVAADGRYLGRLVLGDRIKPDAAAAIEALRAAGIRRIAMLTGDSPAPALATARELGITEVEAALLPEGKLASLERIIRETAAGGGRTLFVGDGINDAPVLARADVGVAMGAGADAAVESADLVLMTDEPARVAEAVSRARRTRAIVVQNIVLALGIKAAFLALGAVGVAVMWEAVIADVGVALLAIANSVRALR